MNKSRAEWRAMLTKIPVHISDFDKVPQISDDITKMIKSNSNVFLEKEVPYCFLSRVERSYAELTLGYNLKHKVCVYIIYNIWRYRSLLSSLFQSFRFTNIIASCYVFLLPKYSMHLLLKCWLWLMNVQYVEVC